MTNNVEKIYALTPMQEGMLYHRLIDEASSSYFVQNTISFHQELNPQIIRDSLMLLTRKHEVLRTSVFYRKIKQPRQIILKERELGFYSIDITDLPAEVREERFERLKSDDLKQGFDLEKDSLMRVTAVKMDARRYKLIWSFHHIIMDGWCMALIVGDFMQNYERLSRGEQVAALREQAEREARGGATFETYVKWLGTKSRDKALAYWGELLSDYERSTGIGASGGNAAAQRQTEQLRLELPDRTWKPLQAAARNLNATVNTLVETAWGLLLQRYNGTDDAVFGKVVSGRSPELDGIEQTVGLFINTVPVRMSCKPEDSFAEIAVRLQRQAADSTQYDYFPLPEIQEQTALKSDLFRTLIAFENYYVDEASNKTGGLSFEVESLEEQTNYPLTLVVYMEDALRLEMMYDPSVYRAEEIQAILDRMSLILHQVATRPELTIGEIELTGAEERQQILSTFNDTRRAYPREASLPALFARQAERTPQREAVRFGEQVWTYAELQARAESLHRALRGAGVRPGRRVGILTDKSGYYIAGLLAILQAGCAYVPLSANDPAERLRGLIADAGVSALLHPSAQAAQVAAIAEGLPCVDWHAAETSPETEVFAMHEGSGEDEAYVLFTSGTTGRPKGVRVRHRSITRLVWETGLLNFGEARVLQTGALAFDASTFEIWGPLLAGGLVDLCEPADVPDGRRLRERLERHQLNTMWMTAQLFNHFVDDEPEAFAPLENLIIGGERLSQRHVARLLEQPVRPRLINGYGPTENTTFSLMHVIEQADAARSIPIGRPIANSKAYIVDPGGRLCGIGQPGELVVGGDGVADGYVNRPELTAKVFVPDRYAAGRLTGDFAPIAGEARLYRTGDLARWRPDGTVDYLGRLDDQVKIRGYRIEPGEIEQALREVEGVRDAAVTVREDADGAAYLCGYAVTGGTDLSAEDLRRELGSRLPAYLVPASLTLLESLPMTVNGKLDRAALPEPVFAVSSEGAAPRSETEIAVIEVFEEILGVRGIGTDASFFELGGHSLRATRAINRLEARTGIRLPLTAIFESPTAAGLAQRIGEAERAEYVPIPQAAEQESYAMSSAQKRLYLIQQLDGAGIAYNLPGLLELGGELDLQRIQTAFAQLIRRHESLRTSFHLEAGELVQRIAPHAEAVVEVEEAENADQKDAWMDAFVQPFRLEQAPLMRLKVIRTGTGQGVLLFDMHHLIADGASMNVITREFSRLYAGEELPEPNRQYKDYSEWMRTRNLGEASAYWQKQFEGEIPVLDLPLDYARPQMQSFAGAGFYTLLTGEGAERVRKLCRQTGMTEYMVFLSAYMILLSRYSRQEDIVVGSPVAGRTHQDTENMIGMFVNTLALRARPEAGKRVEDFLREVKQVCMAGFEHQEFPFEELVERASLRRDLSRNPIFDTMFVHQNNETEELSANKLAFGEIEGETRTAKFDITLTIDSAQGGFRVHWEYCTDLFREETLRRYAKHFLNILEAISADSAGTVGEIDCLGETERTELIDQFSRGDSKPAADFIFAELWQEQAVRFAERTAAVCGTESLTYDELERKADRVSNALVSWGVGTGDVVAFALPKGLNLLAALLGIIKSGAAFLPIEPDYPEDRIRFMVEDSQAKVMITEETVYPSVFDRCKQVPVEVLLSGGAPEAPSRKADADSVAYCIYTSGSTGKPKGAQITHRNLMNYLLYCRDTYVQSTPVMPFFTSVCFDLTLTSLFLPLMCGGRIHVYKEGIEHDLFTVFQDPELTIVKLTPSHLKLAAGHREASLLPRLEVLIVGGEELESRTAAEALRVFGEQIKIHNEYGPTETTIGCCDYVYNPGSERRAVLIGRPITNTQILILGGAETLCGIGMPGELCVGGGGVGEGYLNLPELNRAKFIKNPYASGGRLYRTGDLAQWLPDGRVEYLGRIDEQVKIRGFRIELGEIEEAIKRQPGIADAAVAVKRDASGEPMLCAYTVAEPYGLLFEAERIRAELRRILPEYMVPACVMPIESLEVSPNGKLNRKMLPDPVWERTERYEAPLTELETSLALLFEQTLGFARVGRGDHFFDSGGNSIKAIKLIARLREQGHSISIMHLFKYPTPAELAAFLENKTRFALEPGSDPARDSAAAAKTSDETRDDLDDRVARALEDMERRARIDSPRSGGQVRPLSPIQQMSFLLEVRSSFVEIEWNRKLERERFEQVLHSLFERHPLLRSSFLIRGDRQERIEFLCPAAIGVPLLDLTRFDEAYRRAVIDAIRNSYTRFDDEARYDGNSLGHRMILVKRGERDYVFIMTCTHLMLDGMSSQGFRNLLLDEYDGWQAENADDRQVYDYQTYMDQIAAGPLHTSEDEIIARLGLREFAASVSRYRERIGQSPLRPFKMVYSLSDSRQAQNLADAEFSRDLYHEILKFLFPNMAIPILYVHTGRTYAGRKFHDYLGEFIDFMPGIIEPAAGATFAERLQQNLRFASRHNINMATLFTDRKIRSRYPELTGLLSLIDPHHLDIPVYNDLSIFQVSEQTSSPSEQFAVRTDQTERLDPFSIGIVWSRHKLYIQSVCTEGQEEALRRYLEHHIEQRLSGEKII